MVQKQHCDMSYADVLVMALEAVIEDESAFHSGRQGCAEAVLHGGCGGDTRYHV